MPHIAYTKPPDPLSAAYDEEFAELWHKRPCVDWAVVLFYGALTASMIGFWYLVGKGALHLLRIAGWL